MEKNKQVKDIVTRSNQKNKLPDFQTYRSGHTCSTYHSIDYKNNNN